MKNLLSTLIVFSLIAGFTFTLPAYSADNTTPPPPPSRKEFAKQQFEKRLNLSDKQKEKAKALHEKGREQIHPVMEKIKAKNQELKEIKSSTNLDETAKQEKISKIKSEIKALDRQAREIRKENSAEFEKILNKKQKKELEKMKSEGRANFEKHHPPRPPFGAPDFWRQKPLFQPSFNSNISK